MRRWNRILRGMYTLGLLIISYTFVHLVFIPIFTSHTWETNLEYFQKRPIPSIGEMDLVLELGPEHSDLLASKGNQSNTEQKIDLQEEKSNESIINNLIRLVTKPTYYCTKLLKQGGRTCRMVPDGDKKLCMDKGVALDKSCIVYSIGVGHDFTYDTSMGKFGCQVFAFDHDYLHTLYRRTPFKRVYLANVRVGTQIQYRTVVDSLDNNSVFTYFYRPLDNIMYILHHEDSNIDVLKLDIEGTEFEVFEQSVFKTDILERTRQLAIEIHMANFIIDKTNPVETMVEYAKNYTRFFEGIRSRGFELAYYEPNYIGTQTMVRVAGILVPMIFEQLWVNTRLKVGKAPIYEFPIKNYVNELNPEKDKLIQH